MDEVTPLAEVLVEPVTRFGGRRREGPGGRTSRRTANAAGGCPYDGGTCTDAGFRYVEPAPSGFGPRPFAMRYSSSVQGLP